MVFIFIRGNVWIQRPPVTQMKDENRQTIRARARDAAPLSAETAMHPVHSEFFAVPDGSDSVGIATDPAKYTIDLRRGLPFNRLATIKE